MTAIVFGSLLHASEQNTTLEVEVLAKNMGDHVDDI